MIDPVLIYSAYLGGTGSEDGSAIAFDTQGNAYVTGTTQSLDFPVTPGAYQTETRPLEGTQIFYNDAYVTKLNPAGTAVSFSTVFGLGEGRFVAADPAGYLYVTGQTFGNLPLANPLQPTQGDTMDAFVAKIAYAGPESTPVRISGQVVPPRARRAPALTSG